MYVGLTLGHEPFNYINANRNVSIVIFREEPL